MPIVSTEWKYCVMVTCLPSLSCSVWRPIFRLTLARAGTWTRWKSKTPTNHGLIDGFVLSGHKRAMKKMLIIQIKRANTSRLQLPHCAKPKTYIYVLRKCSSSIQKSFFDPAKKLLVSSTKKLGSNICLHCFILFPNQNENIDQRSHWNYTLSLAAKEQSAECFFENQFAIGNLQERVLHIL